jgi:hypothetical protein
VLKEIPEGNGSAAAESAVCLAHGIAYLGLPKTKDAEPLIDQAEQLDPRAISQKLGVVRLLQMQNSPVAAEAKVDGALALD